VKLTSFFFLTCAMLFFLTPVAKYSRRVRMVRQKVQKGTKVRIVQIGVGKE
jgi:hypothetical protein